MKLSFLPTKRALRESLLSHNRARTAITQYKLADGKTAEIEVNIDVAELLADFAREDRNAARKERWRKEVSIDYLQELTGFEPTDTSVDIEQDYIAREEKENLLAAMSHLSDKQRRLVQLYYYEEKNFTEIAAILGINRRSVSKQLTPIMFCAICTGGLEFFIGENSKDAEG